ncbi:MAG: PD-(D/E)XK nuclease domain-containing protein, partial [Bacteroidales bacterium]|nr:PD-(D/E)XK nuclease domain-containing protein [Bacteroidales bacterium]
MQSAILMAYFYANRDYMVFAELPTGQGFADVAFIPLQRESPAIIVELKKDGEPQVAIDQIKSRNYAQAFKKHPGQGVLLVGITYDPKEHKHKCIIEKVEDYKEVWK